jgi:predicted amidohydrolase
MTCDSRFFQCRELRFIDLCSKLVTKNKAWDSLITARAIENMSYAVGVNGTGEDKTDMRM